MKKSNIILKALIVFVLMISLINVNVSAETTTNEDGIFDIEVSEGTYKYSEGKNIYLPFIRYAKDRILIDKNLSGFGTSFSAQSIEVNADIKGMQVLFASDSIRINNKMEYGILFAGANITISSEIDESLILFAGEKVTITEDAVIKGDIICYSNDIEINGTVKGSVIGTCNNVIVNGTIEKDLRIKASNLNLSDDAIKGHVYIETYNTELSLPESYLNAKINILKSVEKRFDFSIIYTAIITGAVFTLIYYLINKITKNKLIENGFNKVKTNPIVVIFSGAISLMMMPAIFIILIILSALGLYMITIPVLIIYFTFLLIVGLLSTLVIGILISEYMSNSKYLKGSSSKTKYLFAFILFAILYILARVPYIGGYITLIIVILAIGSSLCMIFCKSKSQVVKNNNIEDNNTTINE